MPEGWGEERAHTQEILVPSWVGLSHVNAYGGQYLFVSRGQLCTNLSSYLCCSDPKKREKK